MRGPFNHLQGQKFSRWTVLTERPHGPYAQRQWLCRCECGVEKEVPGNHLCYGKSKSCGCLRDETVKARSLIHGQSHSKGSEYEIWCSMKKRCQNTRTRSYCDYGGRGITVCAEWNHDFQQFRADMGPRPSPQHTLERSDNDGPYSAANCRWATRLEQANNSRHNRLVTYNGRTQSLSNWGREVGIRGLTIHKRLKRGWPLERAMTEPIHQ